MRNRAMIVRSALLAFVEAWAFVDASAIAQSRDAASATNAARLDPIGRLRSSLGFVPRLETRRELPLANGHVAVVASIARRQAARVGCSDLAIQPFPSCERDGEGAATVVVTTDDPAFAPFAFALSTELDIESLSATAVEVDGDPVPEVVIVATRTTVVGEDVEYGAEPEVVDTVMMIIDVDGTIFLDDTIFECIENDEGYFDCADYQFTVLDEDGNGVTELRIAVGIGTDERAIASRIDRVDGDEMAAEALLDLEDSVVYYEYRPRERRFVER